MPPAHEHPHEPEAGTHLVGAAAGHAEVGARHLVEAVAARVGEHRLEVQPRGGLALGRAGELGAGAAQARGEAVAEGLELAEVQQPRPVAGAHAVLDRRVREPGHHGVRQLTLEAGDLGQQRLARSALRGDDGRERRGDGRKIRREVSEDDHRALLGRGL